MSQPKSYPKRHSGTNDILHFFIRKVGLSCVVDKDSLRFSWRWSLVQMLHANEKNTNKFSYVCCCCYYYYYYLILCVYMAASVP